MMFIFIFVALMLAAGVAFVLAKGENAELPKFVSYVIAVVAFLVLGFSSFTQVAPSYVGIVTTFGKIQDGILTEGAHFVLPVSRIHEVYLGQQKVDVKSEAASKDMQSVSAHLAVLYVVSDPRKLFVQNPTQSYPSLIVQPAVAEAFKAVVAQYTAEELVTKRSEVSMSISKLIDGKLSAHHLRTQTVNVVNFDFSAAFNAAIEEKVTASQKAATAERNLERIEYEAQARIKQAEGEAKAIAIQASAVEKAGGENYLRVQAIEKWNGQFPQTMTGDALPFFNVGRK